MVRVQSDTTAFTEKEFLRRLFLDDENVIGVKGLCINGRFLATIDNIKTIEVVTWEIVEDEEHFFNDNP